jgi:hypothetical protein
LLIAVRELSLTAGLATAGQLLDFRLDGGMLTGAFALAKVRGVGREV